LRISQVGGASKIRALSCVKVFDAMRWLAAHRKFTIVATILLALSILFFVSYALRDSESVVG
jgi:hypothetical protein